MRKQTLATVVVFVLSALLPFEMVACTYLVPNYTVGRKFTAHVASRDGMTFAGVCVVLVSGDRVAKTSYTGSQGVARFDEVEVDDYSIEIDQLGELGLDTATISVVNGVNGGDVKLRWPSLNILRATELKGMLVGAAMAMPMVSTSAVLVNALDGSLVARDLIQKTGEFDLGIPAPGFYFMKLQDLQSPNRELDPIPVLILEGPKRELTLASRETSCGMQYAEVRTVPTKTVSHVGGKIFDDSGAVIGRAQIELLQAPAKRVLATVTSDQKGHFDFQYMPDGEYQLRITALGFSPILLPIILASDDKSQEFIDQQLHAIGFDGVSGSSSYEGDGVK